MQHTCDPGEHFISSNRNYIHGNQQSNLFLQIIHQEKIAFFQIPDVRISIPTANKLVVDSHMTQSIAITIGVQLRKHTLIQIEAAI